MNLKKQGVIQLLYSNGDLDIQTVFLLDKVQKKETISKENFRILKKQGLIEGRYPNLFVSFKVADIVGQKANYIRNKGLDDDICKQLIVKALESMGEASKHELMDVLDKALPDVLSENQNIESIADIEERWKYRCDRKKSVCKMVLKVVYVCKTKKKI